ncbi:MAG: hypothetical protein KF870_06090 [Leadbetterella sp.]|nr:hypothetical protein [Leadbetterella sp.]
MMKKIVILLTALLPLAAWGQKSPGLTLRATPKGIFITFGHPDLAGKPQELQRKAAGEAAFKTIAQLTPPQDIDRVRENIREAAGVFAAGAQPTDARLEKVWADYKANNRQTVGFISAVPQLAYIFNLAWLDRDAVAGRTYQYRLLSGSSRFDSEEFNYILPPFFPVLEQQVSANDDEVIRMEVGFPTVWKQLVTADVKRKNITQGPEMYKDIRPLIQVSDKDKMEIIDTTLRVYGAYHYRVQLSDIFGNKDTSVYYFEGNNIPKELVPEVSDVKITSTPDKRALQMTWNVSVPERVQSITLYRSREYEGPYRVAGVFNGKDKSYTDAIDEANELYFYYFEVKDIFGYATRSIRYHSVYEGNSIPLPPEDLTLTESAEGRQLSWSASDRITRGFYVFRKEGLNGTFEQVSPIILIREEKGTYLDSARLNPEYNYFYTVKSESDTYTQSVFSDTLFYQPVPGARSAYLKPPYDIHISYDGKVARLSWENIHEDYPEVLGYQVYRKGEKDDELLTPRPLPFSQNMYLDSTFNGALQLSYVIVSVDREGNPGPRSLPVHLDLTGAYILVPDETGYASDAKGITLKWTGISAEQIKNIKIYRAEDNGKIQLVSTLDNRKTQYRDIAVKKGKSYTYQVSTVDIRGKENRAEPIMVNF